MKILNRTLWALIYALPAVLFFSYYPVISLGADASMNFELSLPLIWLVLFDLASLLVLLSVAAKYRKKQSIELPLAATFATNEERTERTSPRNDGRRERAQKRQFNALSSSYGSSLPGISDRRFFLFALFPLYLTISIFWSPNPLRGLLTAGVMWLVFFAIFAILYILPLLSPPRRWRHYLLSIFLVSSVAVCLFCFLQSILDLIGWSRESTLLCAGCTYRSFGFPHPSGFAIEPQFMGNLLLAPTLTALYLLVFRPGLAQPTTPASVKLAKSHKNDINKHNFSFSQPRLRTAALILGTLILSTTLFFTFSRGAIYAYGVALIIMIICALRRHQFRWSLITLPVISFLISLGLQGTFAMLSPTPETFLGGVTKSIHQLSLGLIDLRPAAPQPPVENPAPTVENSPNNVEKSPLDCGEPVENSPTDSGKPVHNPDLSEENSSTPTSSLSDQDATYFDGYVAESTNIRLNLNQTAIKTWLDAPVHPRLSFGSDCDQPYSALCHSLTPTSILFGVGLGGAGTAMHAAYPDLVTSPKEIVQNQFFSLLLETGLVGILLATFGLLIAFCPQLFSRKFLDGRAANRESKSLATSRPASPFWRHPALPLLLPLVVAYLITLNFFSGLPNALQIYLMPPLLYYLFLPKRPSKSFAASPLRSKSPSRPHGSKN